MMVKSHGTSPFKYWILGNPIQAEYAYEVYKELSSLGNDLNKIQQMYEYDNVFEKKLATDKWSLFPPHIKKWFQWSLTGEFIQNMEKITGIQGLISDGYLRGGGIHIHKKGGILKPHLDFTMHPKLKIIRRLNLIIYLNRNYEQSWGGQLELWSKDMSNCEVKIDPGFNVGVLFETPDAPHGFSVPWNAPNGITRKSLAVYLYTSPTINDLSKSHKSTQFLRAPEEPTSEEIEKLREQRNNGRLTSNIR